MFRKIVERNKKTKQINKSSKIVRFPFLAFIDRSSESTQTPIYEPLINISWNGSSDSSLSIVSEIKKKKYTPKTLLSTNLRQSSTPKLNL